MPILHTLTTPTGLTLNYHRLVATNIDFDSGFGRMIVASYPSEDYYISYVDPTGFSSKAPVPFNHNLSMPVSEFLGEDSLSDTLEYKLMNDSGSPFFGGQYIVDKGNSLPAMRERKWVEMKAARRNAERGNFMFEGGLYAADEGKISGAATAAFMSKTLGVPYMEQWTLVDNSVATLSADQVISLGLTFREYISGLYAHARQLRERIFVQAQTLEDILEIKWGMDLSLPLPSLIEAGSLTPTVDR